MSPFIIPRFPFVIVQLIYFVGSAYLYLSDFPSFSDDVPGRRQVPFVCFDTNPFINRFIPIKLKCFRFKIEKYLLSKIQSVAFYANC